MIKEKIQADIISAMKSGDKPSRDILRYIMSQIKRREVDERRALTESEIFSIIKREARQTSEVRKISDSEELKNREEFLKTYLPEQISASSIYLIVIEYKVGQPDMRVAMKELMAKYGDYTDKKILIDTIRKVYM